MRPQIQVMQRGCALAAAAFAAMPAHASFLSGDTLDSAANALAWVILFLVPAIAIAIFWYVHILPEVIAEKRHHPQKDSIKVLCILSLFFGGMLWPFAWLWAYTKPIAYRAAYGSEKHDDYYLAMGEKARLGTITLAELSHIREELAAMKAKGTLSPELKALAADLDNLAAEANGGRPALQESGGKA
ncbi:MAG TPA: DUF3302 domain-containing protein [Usitatibacter sp.]|nr:DUF3302 domain-containing protein [Usitatibacter sp.]